MQTYNALTFLLGLSAVFTLTKGREETRAFKVYWNVPTYLCKNFSIYFEDTLKKFGITVNTGDHFRGNEILILYDPGLFPIMLNNTKTGEKKVHNGGFPQKGNLSAHLIEFEKVVEKQVASGFNGIAVIDFETWRPIFRQNWNAQVIYRNLSIDFAREKNPNSDNKLILEKAKEEFEKHGRDFMEKTLEKAKQLRPNAKWGFYGFPYCLNYGTNGTFDCPKMVKEENDRTMWLFNASQGLYLSVYMKENLTLNEHSSYVKARLEEAWRVANNSSSSPSVVPYVWYRYLDSNKFLDKDKLNETLKAASGYKSAGAIIWGSSADLKNQTQCEELLNYVNITLGPIVKGLEKIK